jgi:DeoR family fructose operon transcriptional repressor
MAMQVRQRQIMEALRANPASRVSDLADEFGVSESTVRRDLTELENQGLVQRVHGGAIVEPGYASEPPFEVRQITHREEKALAGKAAASLVRDGITIFIDGGTTTPFIVPYLSRFQGLTAVTIGLNVAYELAAIPTIRTIQIGGELHIETWTYTGPLSTQALENSGLTFDLAFISAVGVSAEYGATNQIIDRIPQKQQAIRMSRQVAVVVDGSKVGRVAPARIALMQDIDALVTDQSASLTELAAIAELGPRMIQPTGPRSKAF